MILDRRSVNARTARPRAWPAAVVLATAAVLASVATVGARSPLAARPVDTADVGSTGAPPREPHGGFMDRIVTGLSYPMFVTHAGDSRLFVVEKAGRIKIVSAGAVTGTYLNITDRVNDAGSEEGLLGLAFHPSFRSAGTAGYGRFYVYYTNGSGNNQVSEFRASSPTASAVSATTERRVMLLSHPNQGNHNGGWMGFRPGTGHLYIATGDGGGGGDPYENAQDIESRLGKILRIIPLQAGSRSFTVPSDNPYVGRAGDDTVWARGLRNPWRCSFDRGTGALWCGDVGQSAREEIDRFGKGANLGWDVYEGTLCYEGPCSATGKQFPITEYGRTLGYAVTGGYVARRAGATYGGQYIFGDFGSGRIWRLWASAGVGTPLPAVTADTNLSISSFGEGGDGRIYIVHCDCYGSGGGALYRVNGS